MPFDSGPRFLHCCLLAVELRDKFLRRGLRCGNLPPEFGDFLFSLCVGTGVLADLLLQFHHRSNVGGLLVHLVYVAGKTLHGFVRILERFREVPGQVARDLETDFVNFPCHKQNFLCPKKDGRPPALLAFSFISLLAFRHNCTPFAQFQQWNLEPFERTREGISRRKIYANNANQVQRFFNLET